MKKLLCIILSLILMGSVMMPITVFAENGPYPVDWDKVDLENVDEDFKMSYINIVNINITEEELNKMGDDIDLLYIIENHLETGFIYPKLDDISLPSSFKGISYSKKTNTLTLNNVRMPYGILELCAMGDDFKIKLVGYNEFMVIESSADEWGGSITLTGSGELVVNKECLMPMGITISADETAAFFKAEKDVNLLVGCSSGSSEDSLLGGIEGTGIYVEGSTITDTSKLIQLKGKVKKGGAITKKTYTVDVYEQIDVYDLEWDVIDYSDIVLTKTGEDGLYIGIEDYDVNTFEPNGKYYVLPVFYDDELKMYVCDAFLGEKFEPEAIDITSHGYEIKMDGAIPETIENIFLPIETSKMDLALSEDGTKKYGFEDYSYFDEYENVYVEDYCVYSVTEHSKYGYIVKEIPNKTDLDGLVPQKIGEKKFADAFTEKTLVMNYGGSVAPSAVKGIKAENKVSGVKISWTPVSRATKYRVYRKAPGEKSWTTLATLTGEKTSSYIDKTAKSGVKYSYTVRACNIVGWGTYNKTGVSKTYLKAPVFKLSNITSGVKISWNKISGAEKYNVYRKTPGQESWTKLTSTTSLSFVDKTAKNGKTYLYSVKAVKGSVGSSKTSSEITFVSTPKIVSVKNVKSGVTVSWGKVSGATKYRVYRKASGETSWTKLTDTKSLSFTDKTVKSGKTYSYTVRAYKGSYYGSINKTGISIKYLAMPSLKLSNATSGVKISWNQISGAKTYRVYRKASGETSWTKLTDTKNLSFIDKTAENGKTYSYMVKAVNGSVKSGGRYSEITFRSTSVVKR